MILLRCPKFLRRLRRLPFFLRRKKGRKERRQNQGFGILSAGGVLPASVPFRRANGNEQIPFLAFALPLRLQPLAAHAGPRCPGTAGGALCAYRAVYNFFHHSTIRSAAAARSSAIRSFGSHTTWYPIFPADTATWERLSAVWWNTVGNCFFIPTGLHPPWT